MKNFKKIRFLTIQCIIAAILFLTPVSMRGQIPPPTIGTKDIIDQVTNFNVIPSTPQLEGLGTFCNQGISDATGIPTISIPIYTIQEDGASVPIALNYDASGIRIEDIATEVGLKWSLQAGGSISRTIRGLPDDAQRGWLNCFDSNYFPADSWNSNVNCYQRQLENLADNYTDILPDIYGYNIPGYQGSFFFNRGSGIGLHSQYKILDDDLQIINAPNGWTAIDNKGIIYKFGENISVCQADVQSYAIGGTTIFNPARSGNGINEWKLTSITTKNGRKIEFVYTDYNINYNVANSSVKRFNTSKSGSTTYNTSTTNHSTNYIYSLKLLSQINAPDVRIDFIYATDNAASVWQKKLTEIKIVSKRTSESKSYSLEYDLYGGCAKLRLRKVIERGWNSSASNKVWQFNYRDNNLPAMNSKDIDFFGYYNQAGNTDWAPLTYNPANDLFSINSSGSKNVSNTAVATGILNEIIYPTGGKTKFYYESNTETVSGQTRYAPGVRLQKSEDYTDNNSSCNVKEYLYSGLTGDIFVKDNYDYFRERFNGLPGNMIIMLYSSPKNMLNPKSGYGYTQIETRNYQNNTAVSKEINKYKFYAAGTHIYQKLEETLIYKGLTTLQQKTKYSYFTTGGNSMSIGWRVVSEPSTDPFFYLCGNEKEYTNLYYKGVYRDYKYDCHGAILVSSILTTDFITTTDSITNVQTYGYNSNLQLINKGYSTSVGGVGYENIILYPSTSVYSDLYNKRMIGLPVQVNSYKISNYICGTNLLYIQICMDTLLVDKTKLDYDSNGNPTALYDFVNNPSENNIRLKENYTYESNKKLREIKYRDGTSTIYLWGYNYQYPIAKIDNAAYSEVTANIPEATLKTIAAKNLPTASDTTTINGLRNSLPNAFVTTYTYKPLVGIATITDPRGIVTYYDYDVFGRVKEAYYYENNDKSKKRKMETYDYHYNN